MILLFLAESELTELQAAGFRYQLLVEIEVGAIGRAIVLDAAIVATGFAAKFPLASARLVAFALVASFLAAEFPAADDRLFASSAVAEGLPPALPPILVLESELYFRFVLEGSLHYFSTCQSFWLASLSCSSILS